MGSAKLNSGVTNQVGPAVKREFRYRVEHAAYIACGTMLDFFMKMGMSSPPMYRRLSDPDRFTVGELREMRNVLQMNKADFIEMLRPLL